MPLPDFSVRRPVTVIMFFLGIVLFGFISWSRLPQELYPPITYPQLSVVTFYKDAAPEEMEILVTKPVEEAVGTVSGVRRISSTSKEETSIVIAEFNWGTNMDFAALGVREKIDLIKESLPRGSEDPIVMKFNPFELPLLVLNVTAEKTTPEDLQHIVKKVIKTEIEKAEGVATTNIVGGVTPEILIEIDQDRMMSKKVALNDVVEAVSKANLNYPAGTIEESFYEYLIRTIGEFQVIQDVENVVIDVEDKAKKREYTEYGAEDLKEKQERAITAQHLSILKDIAVVKDTLKEKTSISRFKGRDNVSLSIQKQADANTLLVANSVKDIIKRVKKIIPKDIRMDIVYDQSSFIRSAINGVKDAALQGGVLAFIVLLLFLRNVRGATVVSLNIPISTMAVFSLMYFSGITINMISLGGLALGVGMLVDNGIVVIENIYRHRREEGRSMVEASVVGANEVNGAILGSTLTTIAVFLPMVFVVGIAGQLFKELAFTVTFSLMASLVVALTLIPILVSRQQNEEYNKNPKGNDLVAKVVDRLQDLTASILRFFLRNKFICLSMTLAIFAGACLMIPLLDTEFLPKIDQGQFLIKFDLPPGTRLDISDKVSAKIEEHLLNMPEVESTTVNIGSTKEKKGTALLETMGPNQGQIIVNLKPVKKFGKGKEATRTTSTADTLQMLKDWLNRENLYGANIEYILQDSPFKSAFQSGAPVVIELKGQNLSKLRELTKKVEGKLDTVRGIYSIRDTFIEPAPEVKINVFKEKADTYQLSVSDIAVVAQTAVKGNIATKFKREGEEIDVRIRLRKQDRDNMTKIRHLSLHSKLGIDIPLSEVAYFSVGKGPTEIKRQDQERVVLVTANIFKRAFKEVSDEVESFLKGLGAPPGYSAELTGEREQIEESFNSLRMALLLSVILVFMIMASQFESLWQPFVIMFTIPLSIIGVILILFLTNTPLSVMVILGIIILGGIVVNNGIVLIDYTNILRSQGLGTYDALLLASRRRLRPILMTALTTILALVPLALALNEGAELQQPMAITVIGGLTVSTFLSLIVIPTIYLGLEELLTAIRTKIFGRRADTKQDREFPPQPPMFTKGPEAPLPKAPKGPQQKIPEEQVPEIPESPPPASNILPPEVPAPETPEQKATTQEMPELKIPVTEIPASELPAPEAPEQKAPVPEAPAPKVPAQKTPPTKPTIAEMLRSLEKDRIKKQESQGQDKGPQAKEPEKQEPIILGPPKDIEMPLKDPMLSKEEPQMLQPLREETLPKQKEPEPPEAKEILPATDKGPGEEDTARGKIPVDVWAILSERQQEMIRQLRDIKRMSRKEYAQRFNISIPTASRDLKLLCDKGLIIAKGPAAIGRYYVLKEGI